MNKSMLMPMAQNILETFESENVSEDKYMEILMNVYNDFKKQKDLHVELEEVCFNMLKDIVWFNFEKETDTLQEFGKTYSNFMFCCDKELYVYPENIEGLLKELQDISKKIKGKNVTKVDLIGNEKLFVKDTIVKVVDKREEIKTKTKRKSKKEIVCMVRGYLNSFDFEMEKIKIDALLKQFIAQLQLGKKYNEKVRIDFIA